MDGFDGDWANGGWPDDGSDDYCDPVMDYDLEAACRTGDWEGIWRAYKDGARLDVNGFGGETPLMAATDTGQLHIVQFLLDHGVKVDRECGGTALMQAISKGHLEIVAILLEHGADMNKVDNHGKTPLWRAVDQGFFEIVQVLVEHGADMNKVDNHGRTPLWRALKRGHVELVRYLESLGAAKEITPVFTDLMKSCASGKTDASRIKVLVEHYDDDVNAVDEWGKTPLCWLCDSEANTIDIAVMRLLVEEYGADVNAQTKRGGVTPLMLAAFNGDVQAAEWLLRLNADVNMTDKHGQSAWHYATHNGHWEVNKLLLSFNSHSQLHTINPPLAEPLKCIIPATEIEIGDYVLMKDGKADFLAMWLDSKVMVKLNVAESDTNASFSEQAKHWFALRHPNIQKLYGVVRNGYQLFVCESLDNGSLGEFIHNMSWNERKENYTSIIRYIYDATLGLQYLHERDIALEGVGLEDVFIGSDGVAKLAYPFSAQHAAPKQRLMELKERNLLSLGGCLRVIDKLLPFVEQYAYVGGELRRLASEIRHKGCTISAVVYQMNVLYTRLIQNQPKQEFTGSVHDIESRLRCLRKDIEYTGDTLYMELLNDIEKICEQYVAPQHLHSLQDYKAAVNVIEDIELAIQQRNPEQT
ncbi:unnamed protein product [Phytophthora fragariaefolia]|uniref:Unnamed protein product n=1 Tax=Phytophthora fragariaefolia TaxID=1490495 RepID=A0A9W6XQ61_9STRA|nr:unnamed protein product [Phytophthora fragariaefolia]